jgi:PAS domain S-box-containing protein
VSADVPPPDANQLWQRVAKLQERVRGADDATRNWLRRLDALVAELESRGRSDVAVTNGAHPAPRSATEREVAIPAERDDELVEFLPDAYLLTDRYGMIQKANRAAAALLGKPHFFLIGRPLAAFVALDDRTEFRSQLITLQGVGHVDRLDAWALRLQTGNGESFDAILTAAPMHGPAGEVTGVRWLVRRRVDPEWVRPGERQLRPRPSRSAGEWKRRRFRLLSEAGAMLSRSLDYEQTLASVARLSLPVLGDWCIVDLADGEGRLHCLRVAPASARFARLAQRLEHAMSNGVDSADARVAVLRSGRPRLVSYVSPGFMEELATDPEDLALLREVAPTSCLIVPLIARGQTFGTFTFLFAESGRHHAASDLVLADELAQRAAIAADNARLYQIAQRANQAKSDFLAAMSHELRTPLTAILGYSELLAEEIVGPTTPDQKVHLSRIHASGKHLLTLVEQILEYARVEAGRNAPSIEMVDVAMVVQEAVAVVTPMAERKGLALRVRLPREPVRAESDAGRMRQILINVLGNAVKFTESGEIGIAVTKGSAGQSITFEMWDSGIGIAPENLEHIFDPFWQVEQRPTRRYGGAGLGLSVTRSLCRLLGGDISAASTLGSGSRFIVTLPTVLPRGHVADELDENGPA